MKTKFLIFFLCLMIGGVQAQMTNEKMDSLIRSEVKAVEGDLGGWQFEYGGQLVLIITDAKNNRMRIFTPVVEESSLSQAEYRKMLGANFHSALDAKYSLYEGFVISVYTHPLRELQSDQFIDAMRQVVILAKTFGTTYSSTDLIFNPGAEEAPEEKKPTPSKKKT